MAAAATETHEPGTDIAPSQGTLVGPGGEDPFVSLAYAGDEEGGAVKITVEGVEVGVTDPISFTLSDPELPFEKWVAIMRALGRVYRWSRWSIADGLIFAESAYGDRYLQAADVTGMSPDTLKNLVYVASNVPRSRRVPQLGWSFHAEVAPLDPKAQTKWLQKALDHGWNRDTLRQELRAAQAGGDKKNPEPPAERPRPGAMISQDEQIRTAASKVWREAQPDGRFFRVPREAMALLGAALGEGE